MSCYKNNEKQTFIGKGNLIFDKIYKGSNLIYNKEPWYKSDESGYRYGLMNKSTVIVDQGSCLSDSKFMAGNGNYSLLDNFVWYNYKTNKINIANVTYLNPYKQNVFTANGNLYVANLYNSYNRASGGWNIVFGGYSLSVYGVKNKEIYYITFNTGSAPTIASTTKIMNFTSSVIPSKNYNSGFVIIDDKLYKGANNTSLNLHDDTGKWSVCTTHCGIKDNKLYRIYNPANPPSLINGDKKWVDCFTDEAGFTFAITNKGNLAFIDRNGILTLEPFKNIGITGRWEKLPEHPASFSNGGAQNTLAIRNGALYVLTYDKCLLIDDTRYYVKCEGVCHSNGLGVAISSGNRIIDNS